MHVLIIGDGGVFELFGQLAARQVFPQNAGRKSSPTNQPIEFAHLPRSPWRRAVGPKRLAANAEFVHFLPLVVADFVQVVRPGVFV